LVLPSEVDWGSRVYSHRDGVLWNSGDSIEEVEPVRAGQLRILSNEATSHRQASLPEGEGGECGEEHAVDIQRKLVVETEELRIVVGGKLLL